MSLGANERGTFFVGVYIGVELLTPHAKCVEVAWI